MKDIDFDELDKAVNSLMSKNGRDTTNDAPEIPPVKEPGMPLTAAPVSPGTIRPKSEVAINPDTQPAITPSQPPKQPISSTPRSGMPASRRSGRFMDVVPKKPAPTPGGGASREGVTIAPRPEAASSTSASLPIQPTSPMKADESKPQTASVETAAPKSDWPDPIEMHAMKQNAPASVAASPKVEDAPVSSPKEQENSTDQPLSSPFLPDAKVEKRPLGGATPMVPMVAPEHELQASVPDDSEAQLPAKPSDVAPEAPEEFRGDLMQIESDTHMGVPKTDETHPVKEKPGSQEPTMSDLPAQEEKDKIETASIPTETETTDKVAAESHVGRISIPQQYKEQPSSGEKESGAIYDTDTYHQPLSHPAKKKSGWLWVLWIVLILIVGAGAGVALYFLGIM
jgi:hypothetical protein